MTNTALTLVDFPTSVILKSSKLVFVMLFSSILLRKRYTAFDYVSVLFIIMGMVIFTLGDPGFAKKRVSGSVTGILLLLLSLVTGAAVGSGQEFVMRKYHASEMEVLMYTSSIGAGLDIVWMLLSGELTAALRYCSDYPNSARAFATAHNSTLVGATVNDVLGDGMVLGVRAPVMYMIASGTTAFFAIVCVMVIVKHFGATTVTLVCSGRKYLTVFFSIVFFAKPITFSYLLGAFIVLGSGCANVLVKKYLSRHKAKISKDSRV
jgi:adenosine 3'-phospho 5'-phosphosulfate transporter B3